MAQIKTINEVYSPLKGIVIVSTIACKENVTGRGVGGIEAIELRMNRKFLTVQYRLYGHPVYFI